MNANMMRDIEQFGDETVRELRASLVHSDGSERRAIEDCIALLTDYRLCDMDADGFESLLGALRRGRSPVGCIASPQGAARELGRRWEAYGARRTLTAAI